MWECIWNCAVHLTNFKIWLTNITELWFEIKPHIIMILTLCEIVVYAKIVIVSVVLSTRTIWQHVTKSFWQAQVKYRVRCHCCNFSCWNQTTGHRGVMICVDTHLMIIKSRVCTLVTSCIKEIDINRNRLILKKRLLLSLNKGSTEKLVYLNWNSNGLQDWWVSVSSLLLKRTTLIHSHLSNDTER